MVITTELPEKQKRKQAKQHKHRQQDYCAYVRNCGGATRGASHQAAYYHAGHRQHDQEQTIQNHFARMRCNQ